MPECQPTSRLSWLAGTMHTRPSGTSTASRRRCAGCVVLARIVGGARRGPNVRPVPARRRPRLACPSQRPSRTGSSWQARFRVAQFRSTPGFRIAYRPLRVGRPYRSPPLRGIERSLGLHGVAVFSHSAGRRPHELPRAHQRLSVQRSKSRQRVKSAASCGLSNKTISSVRRPSCSSLSTSHPHGCASHPVR